MPVLGNDYRGGIPWRNSDMHHREQYASAQTREREAWEAVKMNLPGTPTFNADRWAAWQAAIRDVSQQISIAKRAGSSHREGPGSRRTPE